MLGIRATKIICPRSPQTRRGTDESACMPGSKPDVKEEMEPRD